MQRRAEYLLEAESELRCEVNDIDPLTLRLIEGNAEIFGIELAMNKEYKFLDENFAVFTWYGCKIEASGGGAMYTADSTPMVSYVNTHAQLEARRDVALANQDYGPRVLIVGDVDHGKSTTARILSSYAARLDRTPLFVDLDIGQGTLSIPGTMVATQLDKGSINIEEGFCHPMPLAYFFGHASPRDNTELYKAYVDILAQHVRSRMDNDLDAKSSGAIINTCGWVDGIGLEIIHHTIQAFNIDVILVMNHDKLFSSLSDLSAEGITVVKLPTSGGIVRRDTTTRRKHRKCRIKEYFYGKAHIPSLQFSPARMDVKLSNFIFIRAGGFQLSEGMRSMGDSSGPGATDFVKVNPSAELLNSVLAVINPPDDENDLFNAEGGGVSVASHGSSDDLPGDLIKSNVAGFIVVVQLNVEQNLMTVLSPCPGALPSKYILIGSIKWTE